MTAVASELTGWNELPEEPRRSWFQHQTGILHNIIQKHSRFGFVENIFIFFYLTRGLKDTAGVETDPIDSSKLLEHH